MYKVFMRDLISTDEPFIIKTWKDAALGQHFWETKRGLPKIDKQLFTSVLATKIQHYLNDVEQAKTLIACFDKDENELFGYVTCNPKDRILYMVYVKPAYRTKDSRVPYHVATQLLSKVFGKFKEVPITYTQHTGAMNHLQSKWNAVYMPMVF